MFDERHARDLIHLDFDQVVAADLWLRIITFTSATRDTVYWSSPVITIMARRRFAPRPDHAHLHHRRLPAAALRRSPL
jgi:hypothetical protein